MKIALIVGARPNFIKAAPLIKEINKHSQSFSTCLVHTGQHYDHNLSGLFFDELKMPKPDYYLEVGSGSHAEQTAKIMLKLEKLLNERKPDLVVVFGDVNSTLAGSLVAAKLTIAIAHVEAGLRSFDKTMPEEINRIVTDRLSDLLFVTETSGLVNLQNEGVAPEKIFFTGNTMIDSLVDHLEAAKKSLILERLSLRPKEYVAMTLHRPSNVDDQKVLAGLLDAIVQIGERIPVVFPCHPRTSKEIKRFEIAGKLDENALRITEPLGYLDFLKLQSQARFVLTDSGGIQEETTYLNIPCITLRDNTERPVTVETGSNVVTGLDPEKILKAAEEILDGRAKNSRVPDLWDGKAAERIVDVLIKKSSG